MWRGSRKNPLEFGRSAAEWVIVAEKEVARERAQGQNPDLKARWEATHATAAKGAGDATSAWIAGECNRVFGQELPRKEEKSHGGLSSADKGQKTPCFEHIQGFSAEKRALFAQVYR